MGWADVAQRLVLAIGAAQCAIERADAVAGIAVDALDAPGNETVNHKVTDSVHNVVLLLAR